MNVAGFVFSAHVAFGIVNGYIARVTGGAHDSAHVRGSHRATVARELGFALDVLGMHRNLSADCSFTGPLMPRTVSEPEALVPLTSVSGGASMVYVSRASCGASRRGQCAGFRCLLDWRIGFDVGQAFLRVLLAASRKP